MPASAFVLLRSGTRWAGAELDLADVADLDALADALRDLTADEDAGTAVLLLEEDDEYVGVVRLDEDADLRVFLSDVRAAETARGASLLAESEDLAVAAAADADEEEDEDDSAAARAAAVPGGDTALLDDLGVAGEDLLALVGEQGRLPAEAVDELAARLGAGDVLEGLRGTL